jgi:hypothetical protein
MKSVSGLPSGVPNSRRNTAFINRIIGSGGCDGITAALCSDIHPP